MMGTAAACTAALCGRHRLPARDPDQDQHLAFTSSTIGLMAGTLENRGVYSGSGDRSLNTAGAP